MLIDIHTHILPGIDDGAKQIEDSLAMAKVAIQDGISVLVATPHVIRGVFDNSKEEILIKVGSLNKIMVESGIDLLVLPGAEYHLEPDLPQRMSDGELLTINNAGRHIIIELPSTLIPDNADRILYEIQLQGVTPIIAHPERNINIVGRPEILRSYIDRGILAQITSTSVTGLFGRSVQRTARKFLQAGLVQIVASDGHSAHGRAPLLSMAYHEIERSWGMEYAKMMTHENPQKIISGQSVLVDGPPSHIKNMWNKIPIIRNMKYF